MRCAAITCHGPAGQTITLEASRFDAQLRVHSDPESGTIYVADTGLPPVMVPNPKKVGEQIGTHRFVGQFPPTWAFVPQWEEDEAPAVAPVDPSDLRAANGLR